MDNYSYPSYPGSGHSSPRSREIDCETASWDDLPTYKVKFMCSYGGKIHPRPHDNQLTYVGGETKILAVERNIKYAAFMAKLSSVCDSSVCFKYQLPGEDLDALISVTNDEDLEHMMLEYDRLRASAKPARLRLFLFASNPLPQGSGTFRSGEGKPEGQWFVDALNSVQVENLEVSSPAARATEETSSDFLFGLEDKGQLPQSVAAKLQDPTPAATVPEVFGKEIHVGSDCGSEDRHSIGDHVGFPAEMQRQIHELQRLQIANQEEALFFRKVHEMNRRAYSGEYYSQKGVEEVPPPQQSVPMTIPGAYWQAGQVTTGGYPMGTAGPRTDQPVYMLPTPGGVYHASAMRPVTAQVGQAIDGMQRMVPEAYREQQVFNAVPPQQSIPQQNFGPQSEQIRMARQPVAEAAGYMQVGYDGAGRQVFYTAPGGMVPQYHSVATAASAAAVDVRQVGGALNQESRR